VPGEVPIKIYMNNPSCPNMITWSILMVRSV